MDTKQKSNELTENKHFLIALLPPYILGARAQLMRVMDAHRKLQDKEQFTLTCLYVFIFETSSLLEHLSMIQHLLHNANFNDNEVGLKVLDIRNELRHDARYDKGKADKKNKRAERIGKSENMAFQFNASKNGIQCANIELTFNEIDNFINKAEMLMYGTLGGCTIKMS